MDPVLLHQPSQIIDHRQYQSERLVSHPKWHVVLVNPYVRTVIVLQNCKYLFLVDIPSDNITLRPRPSTKQDQPGKPIKIDYSNTISWNSTAEIGNTINHN